MRKIVTGENSVIFGYEDYSVEYHIADSYFHAIELPNGFAGAREPYELSINLKPGRSNYGMHKGTVAPRFLPSWWVSA